MHSIIIKNHISSRMITENHGISSCPWRTNSFGKSVRQLRDPAANDWLRNLWLEITALGQYHCRSPASCYTEATDESRQEIKESETQTKPLLAEWADHQQPQLRWIHPFHFTLRGRSDFQLSMCAELWQVRITTWQTELEIKRIQSVSVHFHLFTWLLIFHIIIFYYYCKWITPRGHCRVLCSEWNIFSECIMWFRQAQWT